MFVDEFEVEKPRSLYRYIQGGYHVPDDFCERY